MPALLKTRQYPARVAGDPTSSPRGKWFTMAQATSGPNHATPNDRARPPHCWRSPRFRKSRLAPLSPSPLAGGLQRQRLFTFGVTRRTVDRGNYGWLLVEGSGAGMDSGYDAGRACRVSQPSWTPAARLTAGPRLATQLNVSRARVGVYGCVRIPAWLPICQGRLPGANDFRKLRTASPAAGAARYSPESSPSGSPSFAEFPLVGQPVARSVT